MPEVVVKYKNKQSLQALEDLSKYLDFKVVKQEKKNAVKKGKVPLLKQIEQGLREVKLIEEGKLKGKSLKEIFSEK